MWNKPQLLMWIANILTGLALMLLFYSVLFLVVHSPLFPIKRIKVDGDLAHTTREQLQYVIKNELKGTFFTLNLDKTRQDFEKLPWVRRVEVRRRWPDRLEVNIEEHKAIARWGSSALLNQHGEQFDAASNEMLPILEGPEGTERVMLEGFLRLKEIIVPLGRTPTHLWLSDRRAWRFELDKQLIVEVGRDEPIERVDRFVKAYPNSLALLQQQFEYVDLRYPNGFAVRLPDYKPVEKTTGDGVKPKPAVAKPKAIKASA
ncbi:FtsQ-type POTRA domain-containing protein [Chitinibacter bivalviorum]|uniref:Cell division protein FtsQ n=1 Tax=Chitinibacter bivalviorum TaxID=2739434 RepID=A0A7H9BLY1_9NEIS|nr:FtsQ-type POTRA domain-containing protein [Chitinibacter bivalviorum]QLG89442.1 FtsQ-type POTRA domain-containing protein [Chitinibacter bivalviorum]